MQTKAMEMELEVENLEVEETKAMEMELEVENLEVEETKLTVFDKKRIELLKDLEYRYLEVVALVSNNELTNEKFDVFVRAKLIFCVVADTIVEFNRIVDKFFNDEGEY